MADVFLMGTSGKYDDPNRSMWREPIKEACQKIGVTCFDPVVPQWTEEFAAVEAEALREAKIVIMAITADTVGMASLAESGWAVLSALLRKQVVGMYVDPEYNGEAVTGLTATIRLEMMRSGMDTIDEASRRARKLVRSHANKLKDQFPGVNLFVASDLDELTRWTVAMAHKTVKGQKWFRR
jgi:hypothetical protein